MMIYDHEGNDVGRLHPGEMGVESGRPRCRFLLPSHPRWACRDVLSIEIEGPSRP
jgi:hypothetical protein